MTALLLCTDLDRTLIPNGTQPESCDARAGFRHLCSHPDVAVAYVSGRHRQLIEQAIDEYQLPMPNWVISDIGTQIYQIKAHYWSQDYIWQSHLEQSWRAWSLMDIYYLLRVFPALIVQETDRLSKYKLSFYVWPELDVKLLDDEINIRLAQFGVSVLRIWSFDESRQVHLLDIVPSSAGKLSAVMHLLKQYNMVEEQVVFAGDSGNDMSIFQSSLRAIVVANAHDAIKQQVRGAPELYQAQGGYLGMNGNYSAGVLEGVAHFRPELGHWLQQWHALTR